MLFLRGVRLPGDRLSDKSLMYSYNFLNGMVARDSRTLRDKKEEVRQITAIWASAIKAAQPNDTKLRALYTEIILNWASRTADAVIADADDAKWLLQMVRDDLLTKIVGPASSVHPLELRYES